MARVADGENCSHSAAITLNLKLPGEGGSAALSHLPMSERISISTLARSVGLSRATLLYYDRIGLLKPSGRTGSGYRFYTERDRQQLERIRQYRDAGLSLADIGAVFASRGKPSVRMLEKRLGEIGEEMAAKQRQQRLLTMMLRRSAIHTGTPVVDKAMWVSFLRAAGMDDAAMWRWHCAFEKRAPQAHENFLKSIGIDAAEIKMIRQRAGEA